MSEWERAEGEQRRPRAEETPERGSAGGEDAEWRIVRQTVQRGEQGRGDFDEESVAGVGETDQGRGRSSDGLSSGDRCRRKVSFPGSNTTCWFSYLD